jgi:hypothetical protein
MIKALVVALFVAGLAASFALASPQKRGPSTSTSTSTSSTTTTGKKAKCQQVELKGDATGGSAAFTVKKASKRGRNLVGTGVSLVIPAGAKVKAKVCTAEGGAMTLRDLHVKQGKASSG